MKFDVLDPYGRSWSLLTSSVALKWNAYVRGLYWRSWSLLTCVVLIDVRGRYWRAWSLLTSLALINELGPYWHVWSLLIRLVLLIASMKRAWSLWTCVVLLDMRYPYYLIFLSFLVCQGLFINCQRNKDGLKSEAPLEIKVDTFCAPTQSFILVSWPSSCRSWDHLV